MTKEEINLLIDNQRKYFKKGNTLDVNKRRNKLIALKKCIKENENKLLDALYKDLGKSKTEGYMCEIGLVYEEINYMVKNIKKFSKPQRVKTPLAQFIAKSYQIPSPYGVVLIMSPWNYPFLLSFDPIVEAYAAGNTIVFKPSRYSYNTNIVMKEILESVFTKDECITIFGGHEENEILINSDVDYIFFTGSKQVGKIVYNACANKLIPVTLELGGKSPCIVDETANIKLAAKRIIFGKLINTGQTCVAPDYIYCHKDIKDKLVEEFIKQIKLQYGDDPINNPTFGHIITKRHFDRVVSLINPNKVVYGGKYNEELLKIEPTILDNVDKSDLVMGEEIFGPILPIMTYDNIEEVIDYVNNNDLPLACYYFSTSKKNIRYAQNRIQFGGGCINDTIIHLATSHMSFGGVGASGVGSYHGKKGFEAFTHYKSIVDKKNIIDLPMRYQPYKSKNEKLIKMFMK